MKTIHYKNGLKQVITQEIANKLMEQIAKGSPTFQIFLFDDKNLNTIINVNEIVCII